MDTEVLILITVLAVLIAVSAFFGAAETAYSSMNHIRMKNLAKEGNKKAAKALKATENYDKLLTTLLIGNNLVNTTAATISTLLFVSFLLQNDPNIAALLSTITITMLLLTFSEITPKCMAMERAEKWAMALAPPVLFLRAVFTPLSIPFVALKKWLTGRLPEEDAPTMTEDELKVMIDEIQEEGTIEKHEGDLIRSSIEFDDITVGEMYTPRVDMVSVSIDADKKKIKKIFRETGFSRLPVYKDDRDHIVGVLYNKDFYNHYFETEGKKIDTIIRPVKFVPTAMKISALLKDLQGSQMHMAIVIDEHGGTVGIVTLEDIIEELIGEIWDENDEIEEEVVENEDGTYRALGGANIHDVMDESGIHFDLEDYEGHTVSGFVLHKLGHIPMNREVITLNGAKIIIRSVKNRRIKEVTIIQTERKETEDDTE